MAVTAPPKPKYVAPAPVTGLAVHKETRKRKFCNRCVEEVAAAFWCDDCGFSFCLACSTELHKLRWTTHSVGPFIADDQLQQKQGQDDAQATPVKLMDVGQKFALKKVITPNKEEKQPITGSQAPQVILQFQGTDQCLENSKTKRV